jgi:hypothetical protein
MLDGFEVPAWIAGILEDIEHGGYARVEMVIVNDAPSSRPTLRDRWKQLPILPFIAYTKLDQRLFGSKVDLSAFESRTVDTLLSSAEILRVKPIQKGFSDRFQADDIAKVRAADLDVILRFGFRIIRGDILDTARFGVWSFHHDDNRRYRGGPALFWEMYEGNPESGSMLQILSEQLDGGRVLYRSTSSTNDTSLFLNRNAVYWKTAAFIPRRLRELHERGWDYIEQLPTCREENVPYPWGIYRIPRPHKLLRFLARVAWINLFNQVRWRLFDIHWFVAVAPRPDDVTAMGRPAFRRIRAKRGTFLADPVLFEHEGKTLLFMEQFERKRGKAVIVVAEVTDDGRVSPPATVLDRPYHLSYPCVFTWDAEIYMIPETSERKTVEVYRAVEFPNRWELVHEALRDVAAVDTTVHVDEGKLWIFMNQAMPGASLNDELFLYVADSPTGEWRPHPMNPIVSDVRHARPAGAIVRERGALYRPAQNSVRTYGGSLSLRRIITLTEDDYAEESAGELTPEWVGASTGTHTLALSSRLVATDGKEWQLRGPWR